MNDTQLLERLSAAYATVEPPAPNAVLAELLESGRSVENHARDAVVVPLVRPRTRVRMRHLVAAMVATFVLFSGLAVAGALPDPVQRQVSSVVSHLGIDLPNPQSGPDRAPDTPRVPDRPQPSSSTTTTPAPTTVTRGEADSTAGTDGAADAPARAPAARLPLGEIGAVAGGPTPAPTTAPSTPSLPSLPSGDGLLPPLPLPPIGDQPFTVPQLPPITVPQLTLPPITLPALPPPLPLPLPLALDLPLLGL